MTGIMNKVKRLVKPQQFNRVSYTMKIGRQKLDPHTTIEASTEPLTLKTFRPDMLWVESVNEKDEENMEGVTSSLVRGGPTFQQGDVLTMSFSNSSDKVLYVTATLIGPGVE